MLAARGIPRACHSCRTQLLSLFEQGFTGPVPSSTSRSRYPTAHLFPRPSNSPRALSRGFATTRVCAEEAPNSSPPATPADLEAVVRQARQTFGETLPKDYLSTEEYVLYERLYGPPLRETKAEDLEYLPGDENEGGGEAARNVLLRQNEDGAFVEVDVDSQLGFSVVGDPVDGIATDAEGNLIDDPNHLGMLEETTPGGLITASEEPAVEAQGKNQREIDAISRLQRDMDASAPKPIEDDAEEIDEEFEEEEEEDEEEWEEEEEGEPEEYVSSDERLTHAYTIAGRSGTSPSTLALPREQLIQPITELLGRASMKHVKAAAEKAFGGKALPHSVATPASKKLLPQKHVGLDAAQHSMTEIEADAYISAVIPGTYASAMNILVEVRKRLGSKWIRDLVTRESGEGPRVLDAGAAGAGLVAWREILHAEWNVLKEEGVVKGRNPPPGKSTVLTGASSLRHRVSRFLDNTTFLPRLPDYIHSANPEKLLDGAPAQGRKSFDLIIAPHALFPLKEDYRRKDMVQNLWSLLDPNGGVLILIEKGLPRGFEAIAGARSLLLDTHISSPGKSALENELQSPLSDKERFREKEEGMIIAPCTNHEACPMYPFPGLSTGRKDFCHFRQRYIRPPFLQKVLGASLRNHEDVKYSYLAVRRGADSRKTEGLVQGDAATDKAFAGYESTAEGDESGQQFHPLALPRTILSPLKRHGHVTIDLCTPSGKLERWIVPKSFSKTAYRDARKSKWGDLWALGAKTRTLRKPRLGSAGQEGDAKTTTKSKGGKYGKMAKDSRKPKKNAFNVIMGHDGVQGFEVDRTSLGPRKRTKGGRLYKAEKPIDEDAA